VTERLYYNDSGLLEFEASVVKAGSSGDNYYTVLDRSVFYPTSGGQSHDTGLINGVEIVDVIESDDGEVRHLSTRPVGSPGDRVRGKIDGGRRRRNQRMHTAQHILSQAFTRLFDAATVSVHLGEEYGAVELASTALSAEQIHHAEKLTNEIIRENLSVEIIFAEGNDVDKLPLRRIPKREGRLRVIKIGEFDYSACGGTHCSCTAEVGLLKIISVEKQRGNILVKFLSGEQSLVDYQRRFEITDKLSQTFTCNIADLPTKVSDLTSRNKSMRREITELQKQLMPIRIEQLSARAKKQGALQVVCQEVSDLDGSVANTLASKLAERISGVAIIAAQGRVIIATSKSSNLNAGELVKRLCEDTAFKGGGSERLAQVGGVSASQIAELASSLEDMIAHA